MLITGALNPAPSLSLRLLIWQTPTLPLGGWIASTAAMGAALSAGGTALALRQSSGPSLRRRVRREAGREEIWDDEDFRQGSWREAQPFSGAERPKRWPREEIASPSQPWQPVVDAGPTRAPGEPAPTVSVPYRVIRQGGSPRPTDTRAQGDPGWQQRSSTSGRAPEPIAEPVPTQDDWSDTSLEEW